MSDFEVRGAEEFLKLSRALKQAGRTELRKELNKGLRDAAKPLVAKTRAAALGSLPQRGGLAARVAGEPQRVQVRTGRDAGVRIVVAKRNGGAAGANRGVVRHPVFGRDVFVEQQVPSGWFDDTLNASAPEVRPELKAALERVAQRVVDQAR
jgi:hypothetical protein